MQGKSRGHIPIGLCVGPAARCHGQPNMVPDTHNRNKDSQWTGAGKQHEGASRTRATHVILVRVRQTRRRGQSRQCWYTSRVGGEASRQVGARIEGGDLGDLGGPRGRQARAIVPRRLLRAKSQIVHGGRIIQGLYTPNWQNGFGL